MFKLPFHIRQQREKSHQKKVSISMMAKSLKGREALDKLNSVVRPQKPTDESQRIAMSASLPSISTDARADSNAVAVGGVCIGDLPESKSKSRTRGQRGSDKPTTRRRPRQCDSCKKWCPEHSFKCTGRGGAKNVTCLILLATEGVDAVLELMQRVARRVKPRVWMPTDVLQQLALLLILTWTHVSTTMIGCIEKLQVAMNKHIFKATSLSLIFLCSMGNIL